MSLSIVHSRAQIGVEAPAVTVEVHLANGLPSLTMVGLPEAAVKESKDRVRSAIINSGLQFPARRITLNLAPADLPKGDILVNFFVHSGDRMCHSEAIDPFATGSNECCFVFIAMLYSGAVQKLPLVRWRDARTEQIRPKEQVFLRFSERQSTVFY